MRTFTNKRKVRIALDYMSGRKTVTQLMREVYGTENRPHIYSLIAHGAKLHYQRQHSDV